MVIMPMNYNSIPMKSKGENSEEKRFIFKLVISFLCEMWYDIS